ncbi:MAG TPA: S8 family serine peptidase, partial [Solirubrobacteraceae bacterium]|nr:S8 family serine peptidase [Solirubrobacteraceae bacterium]
MSDDHRRATIAPSQRTRAALCALALTALVALLCPALASASAGAPATVTPLPRSQYTVDPVCAQPAPGRAACMALQLVARSERARAHRNPIGIARAAAPAPSAEPSPADGDFGLRPQDLHSAYELPSEGASAQTIALVDAYNDPTAEEDLATYSSEFGLPACTGANGCFAKVNENGEAGRLPFPTSLEELESARKGRGRAEAEEASSWAVEMSLDIEVAHAVCSSCHIVLVEANAADYGDLEAAEDTAASRADEISDSWAGAECAAVGVCAGASAAFDHPGKVIAAAAGDEGYLNWLEASGPSFANYPASSPDVVAVGGTRLTPLGEGGEWQGESVWNDGGEKRKGLKQGAGAGGGGCSVQFEAQPWQRALPDWSEVGCEGRRAVADVSADADPYSGVAVYDSGASCEYLEGKSVRDGHWCTLGGTSLATPLIAATFALAGGAQGVEYPAKTLYENAASSATALHDITSGSNG